MSAELLAGMRVLDLTTVVVGPVCTLRLADYGAEVIKVEPPGGDLMRALGGPSPSGRHSGTYLHLNRRKRSICLDLKQAAARRAIGQLATACDAVIANMRPEALERLGLDASTLRARSPALVHCTITGFGPNGPYRGQPAYDSVVQGVSGVAGLFERRDGTPVYPPMLLADHVVGEIAAGAVLAALLGRERSGAGATIEVPMHETMAAFVLHEHLGPASFEPPLGPPGDRRLLDPNSRPLQTADGWISVTANTDQQSRALLQAIGREDLLEDPRFVTVAERFRNVSEWFGVRAEALRTHTTAEWIERFRALDVPAMPCHSLDRLTDDPHLAAVGLLAAAEHPTEGPIRQVRPTILFDGEPGAPGRPAPPVGWDTRGVLAAAGLGAEEIDELVSSGAALDPQGGQ